MDPKELDALETKRMFSKLPSPQIKNFVSELGDVIKKHTDLGLTLLEVIKHTMELLKLLHSAVARRSALEKRILESTDSSDSNYWRDR
jgi:hypothetical protein